MYDEISELIKEAKPLYFKRKRFRRRIKITTSLFMFGLLLHAFNTPSGQSYFISDPEDPFLLVEDISVIEAMGFPTDEYGLLKVV